MDHQKVNAVDIASDLTWVDILKGIAIIGVLFENWIGYFSLVERNTIAFSFAQTLALISGPFVQVFFILSGFGLTLSYLHRNPAAWSWKKWAWRRFSKIILPYEIIVLISFLLGRSFSPLPDAERLTLSWDSLLVHLTLTRSFYPSSWSWNVPMWFIPVIVGLYASFPSLLWIRQRWGLNSLVTFSFGMTFSSLIIAALLGSEGAHGGDIFLFWFFQFALGMALAYVREEKPKRMHFMLGWRATLLGMLLLFISLILRTAVPLGQVFNDPFTSAGIFLVLLNVGWLVKSYAPKIGELLKTTSRSSYLMYLIHYPILFFAFGPMLGRHLDPLFAVFLFVFYFLLIFLLSHVFTKHLSSFSNTVYHFLY